MIDLERLITLRKTFSLNQKEVAAIMNVSREAYCMYETGLRKPSIDSLAALADYYHVSIDYIAGLSEVKVRYLDFTLKQRYILRYLSLISEKSLNVITAIVDEDISSRAF